MRKYTTKQLEELNKVSTADIKARIEQFTRQAKSLRELAEKDIKENHPHWAEGEIKSAVSSEVEVQRLMNYLNEYRD